MSTRRVMTAVVALSLVAGFGYWLGNRWEPATAPRFGSGCMVEADGNVRLDHDQMANAATISAVGVRLGMPDQAVVVALATALQESKLRNLPHLGNNNDHDSVGLFQQRPSQGWGTEQQVGDPRYAAEQFYAALSRVDGWEDMRVTDAAQRVQRSAYPDAYQQWAGQATVLATALLGRASGAVSCTVPEPPAVAGEAAAAALSTQLLQDWSEAQVAVAGPAGLTVSAGGQDAGWRYAHWLVSYAADHGVTRVQFADLEWTADRSSWSRADDSIDHVLAEVSDASV